MYARHTYSNTTRNENLQRRSKIQSRSCNDDINDSDRRQCKNQRPRTGQNAEAQKVARNGRKTAPLRRPHQSCTGRLTEAWPKSPSEEEEEEEVDASLRREDEKRRGRSRAPGLMDILTYTADYLPPRAGSPENRNQTSVNRSYARCHGSSTARGDHRSLAPHSPPILTHVNHFHKLPLSLTSITSLRMTSFQLSLSATVRRTPLSIIFAAFPRGDAYV